MALAFVINFFLVAGLVAVLTFASPLLGARRTMEGDKGLPYETGMRPMEHAAGGMWVSYFRFAVLFVIFDVDLAFLVPWVLLRGSVDLAMMISLSVFVGLVAFTLAYLWRKGALQVS